MCAAYFVVGCFGIIGCKQPSVLSPSLVCLSSTWLYWEFLKEGFCNKISTFLTVCSIYELKRAWKQQNLPCDGRSFFHVPSVANTDTWFGIQKSHGLAFKSLQSISILVLISQRFSACPSSAVQAFLCLSQPDPLLSSLLR